MKDEETPFMWKRQHTFPLPRVSSFGNTKVDYKKKADDKPCFLFTTVASLEKT